MSKRVYNLLDKLYTATLIAARGVIPMKPGIQIEKTGFPRIKYPVSSTGQAKAGLIKSGMTRCIKSFLRKYIR